MKLLSEFTKGFFKENPTFVLLLGLCPTLAVTTGLKNALGMGLASTFVLICSNVLISIIKKLVPKEIRIPVYIVVIATFVTMIKLLLAAKLPELKEALGIFLPLIVVNCIILGRAEAFASKNGPVASALDGLGIGLGFTLGLSLIGIVREILGGGCILGIPITRGLDYYTIKTYIMPPGGFLTMGLLLAGFKYLSIRKEKKEEIRRNLEAGKQRQQVAAPADRVEG